MSRHRHRSSYQGNTANPLSLMIKYTFLLAVLAGVGGLTWVALTPVDAPTHEVVRQIPNEQLGPT